MHWFFHIIHCSTCGPLYHACLRRRFIYMVLISELRRSEFDRCNNLRIILRLNVQYSIKFYSNLIGWHWNKVTVYCSVTTTAPVTCVCELQQWQHVNSTEVRRLSKHGIYEIFSERIHFYEYLNNTYISWQLFNDKCSTESTERV